MHRVGRPPPLRRLVVPDAQPRRALRMRVDRLGRAQQVPPRHQVGVRVVVAQRAVLVRPRHPRQPEPVLAVVVPERDPQPRRLHQQRQPDLARELRIPRRPLIAQHGIRDVGPDVHRRAARRPVPGALLPRDRPPRERRARPPQLPAPGRAPAPASRTATAAHPPPRRATCRSTPATRRTRCPRTRARRTRTPSAPSPGSPAAPPARPPATRGTTRTGSPAAARRRRRPRRPRPPRTSSRYARCSAHSPSQPVCTASASPPRACARTDGSDRCPDHAYEMNFNTRSVEPSGDVGRHDHPRRVVAALHRRLGPRRALHLVVGARAHQRPGALRPVHERHPQLVGVNDSSPSSGFASAAAPRGSPPCSAPPPQRDRCPSSLATSSLWIDQARRPADRLDLVLDRRHAPLRERHQPLGPDPDLRAGRRAPVHLAPQHPRPEVEHALVRQQLAVADVEQLVVDVQPHQLGVGDVDDRLPRLRVPVRRLGVRQRPRLVEAVEVRPRQPDRLALVEVPAQADVAVGQREDRLGLRQRPEVQAALAQRPRVAAS